MSRKTRKKVPAKTKLAILKSHLQGKAKISELCENYGVAPFNIYQWQNQLFSDESIFERKNDRRTGGGAAKRCEEKLNAMEAKLQQKNEVISEMMEEIIKLKKFNGVI